MRDAQLQFFANFSDALVSALNNYKHIATQISGRTELKNNKGEGSSILKALEIDGIELSVEGDVDKILNAQADWKPESLDDCLKAVIGIRLRKNKGVVKFDNGEESSSFHAKSVEILERLIPVWHSDFNDKIENRINAIEKRFFQPGKYIPADQLISGCEYEREDLLKYIIHGERRKTQQQNNSDKREGSTAQTEEKKAKTKRLSKEKRNKLALAYIKQHTTKQYKVKIRELASYLKSKDPTGKCSTSTVSDLPAWKSYEKRWKKENPSTSKPKAVSYIEGEVGKGRCRTSKADQ